MYPIDSPQRCRLCIARCIARSSSIVLVDEATSCVDGETDALIQEASPWSRIIRNDDRNGEHADKLGQMFWAQSLLINEIF